MTQQEAEEILRQKYLKYVEMRTPRKFDIFTAKEYVNAWVLGYRSDKIISYYTIVHKKTKLVCPVVPAIEINKQIADFHNKFYWVKYIISALYTIGGKYWDYSLI